MLWGAITTALLFGAYRFIGNVLDYAGDTREDFMREYAEADRKMAVGSDLYRADGGRVAGEAADRQVTQTLHNSSLRTGRGGR